MPMQKLYIEATNTTPRVGFDPVEGKLIISGRSMPEDSDTFFSPIFEWLEEYTKNPQSHTELVFNFEYYNSATLRCVLELMHILKNIQEPNTLKIIWYYEDGDESSQENGEDLQYTIEFPIELRVLE